MTQALEQPPFLRQDEKTGALKFAEEKAEVYKILKAVGKCNVLFTKHHTAILGALGETHPLDAI